MKLTDAVGAVLAAAGVKPGTSVQGQAAALLAVAERERRRHAAEVVNLGVVEGRIGAHTRMWWVRQATKDPEAVELLLSQEQPGQFHLHTRPLTREEARGAELFGLPRVELAGFLCWLDASPKRQPLRDVLAEARAERVAEKAAARAELFAEREAANGG